ERLPVRVGGGEQEEEREQAGARPAERAAELPAAGETNEADKAVQQVPGLIDAKRREFVQSRRDHVEGGAVIVEIEPAERAMIAEQRQVVVEREIAVPVMDVLVPGDAVIGKGQEDEKAGGAQQRQGKRIPSPLRAQQCPDESHWCRGARRRMRG